MIKGQMRWEVGGMKECTRGTMKGQEEVSTLTCHMLAAVNRQTGNTYSTFIKKVLE